MIACYRHIIIVPLVTLLSVVCAWPLSAATPVVADTEVTLYPEGSEQVDIELTPAPANTDQTSVMTPDTLSTAKHVFDYDEWEERQVDFNPDPTRAVWMSALFPGLGQLYNRRYWKLPIVVGAYLGLGYATSWNNSMLRDYSRAYRDLLDNDPNTNSYMDFFPPTVDESSLDKQWLTNIMRTRKDYFRRNRDLCIISMVGIYLLAMVDAYVDASLSHFDISPELSIDWSPRLIQDSRDSRPAIGLACAFTF